MDDFIKISNLTKAYDGGFKALDQVDLNIRRGEILALLGPNGAGKTTLISTVCGLTRASEGSITIDGLDVVDDYRQTREMVGLVPQELTTDAFETVWSAVSFTRGLFGQKPNPALIEKLLRDLSLWDKKDNRIMTLSGGMKRRLLIAKALSHEPRVLFLDEPTAGVDVELRRDMWALIHQLRLTGVTVILTTHYIEEAQEMADRVAVINAGKIILVEEKDRLMAKLGRKSLSISLVEPVSDLPAALEKYELKLSEDGTVIDYGYDTQRTDTGIEQLLSDLKHCGLVLKDLKTTESSLEEIFVSLVGQK